MRNVWPMARKAALLGLVLLSVLAFSLPALSAAASSDDPARSYCVRSGYLYRAAPGLNNGMGICEFSDKSWCDAQAFYAGECGPNRIPWTSTSYQYPAAGTWNSTISQMCSERGGMLQEVHTPYGDMVLCVLPGGQTCSPESLYSGSCWQDDWLTYARSWLNAP